MAWLRRISPMSNEKHKLQVHSFVAKRLTAGLARIERAEIETVGANMGLDPEESIRLFEGLEGERWRGDYLRSDGETGWTAVRVTEVR